MASTTGITGPRAAQRGPARGHTQTTEDCFDLASWAGSAVKAEGLPQLKKLYEQAHQPDNGWTFHGEPMSREEVQVHYGDQHSIFSPDQEPWGSSTFTNKERDGDTVLFNFRAVHCFDADTDEDFMVELGDCILTEASEFYKVDGSVIKQLIKVVEIFMTTSGQRCFRGQWYYQQVDTAMACSEKKTGRLFMPVPANQIDERRLWLATVEDSKSYPHIFPLACIDKKVHVLHVQPGQSVLDAYPDYNPETDYWWNQVHTKRCITNEDCYEDWSPFSSRYIALAKEQGLEAVKQLLLEDATSMIRGRDGGKARQRNGHRVIVVLDIFAGAGGLSFIVDAQDERTRMEHKYAVDINASACATLKANHPQCNVFHYGLDQAVMLWKMYNKLQEEVLADDSSESDGEAGQEGDEDEEQGATEGEGEEEGKAARKARGKVLELLDVRLRENAPKYTKGANLGQLVRSLTPDDCWLEFCVRRQGHNDPAWEKLTPALQASKHMRAFVELTNAQQRMPRPGDVQLVAGGPPCQGVSGLNRHATQEDVLKDPRNRLVGVYFELVEYLRPNYIIMEQVPDIFRKEDGVYARFAVCQLVRHGYQTRVGQCTAGNYGCPQGRRRVFFWGALSGQEQLPAFPVPTHRCKNFNTGVGQNSLQCHIDFQNEEQRAAAHPMVLLGDVLSDLPPVHNYSMTERHQYLGPPQTPMQRWFRRAPPAGSRALADRCNAADELMGAAANRFLQSLADLQEQGGVLAVGRSVLCKKDPIKKPEAAKCNAEGGQAAANGNFAAETWAAHIDNELGREEADGDEAVAAACASSSSGSGGTDGSPGAFKALVRRLERNNIAATLGAVVMEERDKALVAQGTLRDHRPLMCNADDFLRMVNVPKAKGANFRDLPGVVTNSDGTACGGHWHTNKKYNKLTGTNTSACGGGGLDCRPKASNNKASRVDNYGAADKGAWRGTLLPGCDSRTAWLPTGDLLAPRWTITYKGGKSNGRHGCFGRTWEDEIQSTVVTRAEPHNLQLVHPEQNRVLTIRENARCQGFPDYHVLVGLEGDKKKSHGCAGGGSVEQRYIQMGNAVAPVLALMLGNCLRLAAQGESPVAVPVIAIRDAAFEACMADALAEGLSSYAEAHDVAEKDRGYHWKRHRPDAANRLAEEIVFDDEEEPADIANDDDDNGTEDGSGGRANNNAADGEAGPSGANRKRASSSSSAPSARAAKRTKAAPGSKGNCTTAAAAATGTAAAAAAAGPSTAAAAGAGAKRLRAAKAAQLPPRPPRAAATAAAGSGRPSRGAAQAAKDRIWLSSLTDEQRAALEMAGAAVESGGAAAESGGAGAAAGSSAGGGAPAGAAVGTGDGAEAMDWAGDDVLMVHDEVLVADQGRKGARAASKGKGPAGSAGTGEQQPVASALQALCDYGLSDEQEDEQEEGEDLQQEEDEELQQEEGEELQQEEEEEQEGSEAEEYVKAVEGEDGSSEGSGSEDSSNGSMEDAEDEV